MEIGIDPIAFSIGSTDVRWYGIFIALAIVTVLLWVLYFGRRIGITPDFVFGAGVVGVPTGIIVSKLLHVIDQLDYYVSNPGDILGRGGLTVFGAILGGVLGAWIYCRLRKFPFGPLADVAAPAIALAQVAGRIGCTINGCCHGGPTSLPWGFVYTHPDSYATLNVAVHPTQVYEILLNLFLFVVVFCVLRGRLKPEGSLLAAYVAMYSIGTFGIRFLRGDTDTFLGSLQQAQVVSLVLVAVCLYFLARRTRWVDREVGVRSEGFFTTWGRG